MNPAGTCSGASVTTQRAAPRCREHFEVGRRRRADQRRIMHAGFFAREKRPLEMKTEHRGLACASLPARRRSPPCVFSGRSVISVGSRPVVPNRRCAAAIAAIDSAVGASLNSTSPPPLTWRSTKPGASQAPSGSAMQRHADGRPGGRSARSARPRPRRRRGDAASRRRRRSPPRRRIVRTRSSGAGHLLQVTRPIDVVAAARRDAQQQLIEALDQADRVGVRMVRRQCRKKRRTGAGLRSRTRKRPCAPDRSAASRCRRRPDRPARTAAPDRRARPA